MTTKLKPITTQYRKFNENQVLTEDQLNEFLEYFEDQDHLSRIGLSGVGIVCGFQITFDSTNSEVTVSQGYGVTTDGDLITLQNPYLEEDGTIAAPVFKAIDLLSKTYTHYKSYSNDKVNYTPFFNGGSQISLFELYENEGVDAANTSLEDLPDLVNKVALLYLENYPKDEDLCTALSCDNQGVEQVARVKVLLVSIEDAIYISNQDTIYQKHNWNETYMALPKVAVKRVVLNTTNTQTLDSIKSKFYDAIKQGGLLSDLKTGYEYIFSKFDKTIISSSIDSVFNFSLTSTPADFQYRYDVLKDLVDTYNDIKELLLHINVECCPDIDSFSKHIMLGKLIEPLPYKSLRHQFYKSPIIGSEDENYQQVLSLLDRAKNIAEEYISGTKGTTLKITPSKANTNLGKKAIPFYYDLQGEFLEFWNFSFTKNFRQGHNLGYHTEHLAGDFHIKNPLEYNIDQFDFFRIEGHQGLAYKDALSQIQSLKAQHGLGFDVKALSINVNTEELNPNDYRCEFGDLEVLLKAFLLEQACIFRLMASFFGSLGLNNAESATRMTTSNNSKDSEKETLIDIKERIGKKASKNVKVSMLNYMPDNEGTIGYGVKQAFSEKKGACAGDVLMRSISLLEDSKTEKATAIEYEQWEPFVQDSATLLVYAEDLNQSTPENLSEFSEQRISEFEASAAQLANQVSAMQRAYAGIGIAIFLSAVAVLGQIASFLCAFAKIAFIYAELQRRKGEILLQLQLSNFVTKHPALEHKAGVEPGGTFVIVYVDTDTEGAGTWDTSSLQFEFLEQPVGSTNPDSNPDVALVLWDAYSSINFSFLRNNSGYSSYVDLVAVGININQTVRNVADFLNSTWERAGLSDSCTAAANSNKLTINLIDKPVANNEFYVAFDNLKIIGVNKLFFPENGLRSGSTTSQNTVVADFALPYMCCSDCNPINFIVQETIEPGPIDEEVDLSITPNEICYPGPKSPPEFIVVPEDGIVTADVPEGVNGGVNIDAQGKYVFEAGLVSPSLYDTPIKYLVNNQETDCEIIMHAPLNYMVEVTPGKYIDNDTKQEFTFEVIFTPPLADEGSLGFKWTIKGEDQVGANSSLFETAFPVDIGILNYAVYVTDENDCVHPVNGEITVIPPDVVPPNYTLHMPDDVLEYCPDDETPYPIIIDPETPAPIVHGDGVRPRSDGGYEFVPENVPPDKNNATLKIGEETLLTLDINRFNAPVKTDDDPTLKMENGQVVADYTFDVDLPPGSNEGDFTYRWSINEGEITSTEKAFNKSLTLNPASNVFKVELTVIDDRGCVFTDIVNITIPYPDIEITLQPGDKTSFCTNDEEDYTIQVSPTIEDLEITDAPGIRKTGNTYKFRPSDSNLSTAGTIPIKIAGQIEKSLNIGLPKTASFNTNIIENKVWFNNTSTSGTRPFIWNIEGIAPITKNNKDAFFRTLNRLPNKPSIVVRLTISDDCNTFIEKQVTIRDREITGIPDTREELEEERALFDNMNIRVPRLIRTKYITPTIQLYDRVIQNADDYMQGNKNSQLASDNPEIPDTQYLFDLLNETGEELLNRTSETSNITALSIAYAAQVKLFYAIVKHQETEIVTNDSDYITPLITSIETTLDAFKREGIVFDKSNRVKNYLNDYSSDSTLITNSVNRGIPMIL